MFLDGVPCLSKYSRLSRTWNRKENCKVNSRKRPITFAESQRANSAYKPMQANEQGSNRKPKKTQKNDDKIFPDLIDTV